MKQKGVFIWYKNLERAQLKGQIAVFLTLLIAVIFIFMAITMNISQVSRVKTATSIASDSTALHLASFLGSIARGKWKTMLAHIKQQGSSVDEEPDKYEVCKFDWKRFFSWAGSFFLYLIPYVGPLLVAISQAINNYMYMKSLQNMQRALSQLLPKTQTVEGLVSYSLGQIVDDPNKEPDIHDLDEDGDLGELVPRFSVWDQERVHLISQNTKLITALVNQVRSFFNVADWFRQDWAGVQIYPELKLAPDWIAILQTMSNKYLDKGPPPANNDYYPEDGVDMALLADFEAVKLPKEGSGEKEPMKIKNVNISELDNRILTEGDEYEEELKYDFPFWEPGIQLPQAGQNPIDYTSRPCDLGGMGEDRKGGLLNGFDEVDFMVESMEQFRYWAYGQYAYDYELREPEEESQSQGLKLKFNKGLTEITPEEYKGSLQGWYSQFYNLDNPEDIDLTNNSWYVRILDLASKTGGPLGNLPQCGWWKELDKVLREKPFFNLARSDVASNSLYKGLGVLNPSASRKAYEGGKRRELRDKMDKICAKIMELKGKYNSSLCAVVSWSTPCSSGSVGGTAPLAFDCKGCYKLPCIQALLSAAQAAAAANAVAIAALNQAQVACEACYKKRYDECMSACSEEYSGCTEGCDEDDSACESECDSGKANCDKQCEEAYRAGLVYCNETFTGPIQCREVKQKELADIIELIRRLITLVTSLDFVEKLIPRVENVQDNIDNFWRSAKPLLSFVDATLEAFRFIDEVDCSPPTSLSKFGARVPAWYTALANRTSNALWYDPKKGKRCDRVSTYSWTTIVRDVLSNQNKDIHHYARVTIFDFPIPEIKVYACRWGFGAGSKLVNYDGLVAVAVERFDEDKTLALGGKTNWFNWVFRQRPLGSWESGCGSVGSVAGNASEALACYGIRSYSIAQFYPEIESEKHPGKGIKIIEAR